VKDLQQTHGAPGVKQQLAAVRMLFDWLITGQIVPMNPAAAVRGPKHVVKTGKTPVLEGDKWRKLLASLPTATLRDLRDARGPQGLAVPPPRAGTKPIRCPSSP
jgi:site-specific recombinase XerC